MSDVVNAISKLNDYARELDTLSKQLEDTTRELEPVAKEYDEIVADAECSFWDAHMVGAKLPAEALRVKLARRQMDPAQRDTYDRLNSKRKRLEKRIADLKPGVEAQRSILSALKIEMEATAA